MTLAFIIATIVALTFLGTVIKQDSTIKELRSSLLKEKKLVQTIQNIHDGFESQIKKEEEKYELIQIEYQCSDSSKASKTMPTFIGKEILKKYSVNKLPLADGQTKYSIVLKIKQL